MGIHTSSLGMAARSVGPGSHLPKAVGIGSLGVRDRGQFSGMPQRPSVSYPDITEASAVLTEDCEGPPSVAILYPSSTSLHKLLQQTLQQGILTLRHIIKK